MDDIVRRAMLKWPNVPAVFGWLGLDMRGQWLIQGEHVGNALLAQFIDRNYGCDRHGRWFFQNGPQRVFVALAYAPWILRVEGEDALTHTRLPVQQVTAACMDRGGVLVLGTEHGAGIVDDRDLEGLSGRFTDAVGNTLSEDELTEWLDRLQAGQHTGMRLRWQDQQIAVQPIEAHEVPGHFGYARDPQPLPQERANR
jgi:hypothetical protein